MKPTFLIALMVPLAGCTLYGDRDIESEPPQVCPQATLVVPREHTTPKSDVSYHFVNCTGEVIVIPDGYAVAGRLPWTPLIRGGGSDWLLLEPGPASDVNSTIGLWTPYDEIRIEPGDDFVFETWWDGGLKTEGCPEGCPVQPGTYTISVTLLNLTASSTITTLAP